MSLQCFILSGVSGAGKSRWIQDQPWAKNADIHSSDDHFIQLDGSYVFDFTKLQEAHNACLTSEEISPYYNIALAHGYEVTLVNLLIDPALAAERTQHQVPLDTIRKMQHKMLDRVLPQFWKLNIQNYIWDRNRWVSIQKY